MQIVLLEQTHTVFRRNTATDGVIFSDGMHTDFMQLNRGEAATISVARKRVRWLVQ